VADELKPIEKPGAQFLARTRAAATKLLETWVGAERSAEAVGRVSAAFQAAVLSARDPSDFYACTPESVSQCVAISAITGLMPGTGPAALAYVVPRRPRKGAAPNLQYMLSHRGIAALARRAGNSIVAIPISLRDKIEIENGEVLIRSQDIDYPPMSHDDLRGVVVIVRDVSGSVLFRGWVPKALIEQRRQLSDSWRYAADSSPWGKWPVEMAMKTALHYAVARGWVVIDDTEAQRALSIDQASDVSVAEPEQPARKLADKIADPPPDRVEAMAKIRAMLDLAWPVDGEKAKDEAVRHVFGVGLLDMDVLAAETVVAGVATMEQYLASLPDEEA
jgi:recombinational DNA repair protein RecT